jgi:hypothetical protein
MNKKLIKEGAEKAVAEFAGYTIYHTDGKWYQTKGDIKRGKGLTSDQLWEKHGDSYKRHIESRRDPNADAVASGASPDRHESVEYDGEELEESGRFTPSSPYKNINQSRTSLSRGYKARGMESGLPGPDNSPYGRARMRAADLKGKTKINKAKDGGTNTMFAREFGEELFHKDTDRLLREHIRAEYEARGMYPTAREVQETFNQVMSLLEKTAEEERIEAHKARRGVQTKISPSSPARKQSPVEVATRNALGRGISSEELQKQMNKLRKTNR